MSDEKELTGLKEHEVQGECRHHWIIDSPAGPVSKGLCRLCGEERLFRNYQEGGNLYESRHRGVGRLHMTRTTPCDRRHTPETLRLREYNGPHNRACRTLDTTSSLITLLCTYCRRADLSVPPTAPYCQAGLPVWSQMRNNVYRYLSDGFRL